MSGQSTSTVTMNQSPGWPVGAKSVASLLVPASDNALSDLYRHSDFLFIGSCLKFLCGFYLVFQKDQDVFKLLWI